MCMLVDVEFLFVQVFACQMSNVKNTHWFGYFSLVGHLYFVGVWSGENQRTNTLNYMLKRDWITSSTFINYFVLNSEHN